MLWLGVTCYQKQNIKPEPTSGFCSPIPAGVVMADGGTGDPCGEEAEGRQNCELPDAGQFKVLRYKAGAPLPGYFSNLLFASASTCWPPILCGSHFPEMRLLLGRRSPHCPVPVQFSAFSFGSSSWPLSAEPSLFCKQSLLLACGHQGFLRPALPLQCSRFRPRPLLSSASVTSSSHPGP